MSSSHLPGVYMATKKNGTPYYRCSLTYHKKHISLGSFNEALEAHSAYLEGLSILENKHITLEDYSSTHLLSFEKWVCLINFRDNGLYFHTPIYLFKKFFYYYFSLEDYLIFDTDDLFYYSSHKIMRRKGHLFVADYGMQVNIMNRYGIKNYARLDIDYLHINGDTSDYRYENIEILNSYYGVTAVIKKGKRLFKSAINVNGTIVIGYYETALFAAIAYNKAIDILKKRGSSKMYTENYIDELPPKDYAKIYTQLAISNYFTL